MTNPNEKPATTAPGKPDPVAYPKHTQPSTDAPTPGSPVIKIPAVHADAAPSDGSPKQMQQAMPSSDALKGKWQQQVGAAKIMWSKLTDDELLKLEGEEQKLAGLVQERYAVSRDEAARQARNFFAKHMS